MRSPVSSECSINVSCGIREGARVWNLLKSGRCHPQRFYLLQNDDNEIMWQGYCKGQVTQWMNSTEPGTGHLQAQLFPPLRSPWFPLATIVPHDVMHFAIIWYTIQPHMRTSSCLPLYVNPCLFYCTSIWQILPFPLGALHCLVPLWWVK